MAWWATVIRKQATKQTLPPSGCQTIKPICMPHLTYFNVIFETFQTKAVIFQTPTADFRSCYKPYNQFQYRINVRTLHPPSVSPPTPTHTLTDTCRHTHVHIPHTARSASLPQSFPISIPKMYDISALSITFDTTRENYLLCCFLFKAKHFKSTRSRSRFVHTTEL